MADELAALANRATARDRAARPPDPLAFRQALLDHLLHRASLRLSSEADRTMADIELRPADAQGRAIEECRFGYREALREWPDNPDALRGLRRCAIATVRVELARRSAAAARAALADLADPPPELSAEVASLEAAELADQQERVRLRLLASDADSRIGGTARLVLVLILSILATAVTLYAIHLQARGQVGSSELIALPSFLACGTLVAVAIARRRVLLNAFSRRLVAWFLVLMLGLVASRVVGQAVGLSPAQQFTVDGVLMTAVLAAGAIYNFRWLWLCAAMTGGATVVCVLVPEIALVAFGATASALPIIAVFLMRGER